MRFKTPVFICGATALGIATAVRLGDRAVLAEENGWAAGEFAAGPTSRGRLRCFSGCSGTTGSGRAF